MASINQEQVKKIAEFLKSQPAGDILNFHSFGGQYAADYYPDIAKTEIEREAVIKFFFLWGLHNWGFWYHDEEKYVAPMYGNCNGKRKKGAELWSFALMRAYRENLEVVEPEFLAVITPKQFRQLFRDDDGPISWPNFNKRFAMTKEYGQFFVDFLVEDRHPSMQSPATIVDESNKQKQPISFLYSVSDIEGYGDPLQKRSILLAMALANRPEHFLKVGEYASWPPIIDYHLMRLALRTGMVKFGTMAQGARNIERQLVVQEEEQEIRQATYETFQKLIKLSGRTMFDIDHLFWNGRRYCAEETEPECSACPLSEVCEKRTSLFQPVFETDAY